METIKYDKVTVENILNALNELNVVGIRNMELITFVVQELKKMTIENTEAGEVNGN